MAGVIGKSFASPDESRRPEKTAVDVVHLGMASAARLTLQPRWKWSECVKPVAGTDLCMAHHVGAVMSGTMHIVHEDGTEADAGPGTAYVIEPGHDAWVTSDEPFVAFEFDSKSAETYAKEA